MFIRILLVLTIVLSTNPRVFAHEPHAHTKPRTISVSGKASISSSPDKATVNFSIISKNKDPEKARKENAETAKKVLNAVRALNIPESNIHLETLNINEEFKYNHKTRSSESQGYKATRSFKVVIEMPQQDIKNNLSTKLAELVSAVVSQGSNQLKNVQYGLIESASVQNLALRKAVENAKHKAEMMLEPLGAILGSVQSINESSSARPIYSRMMSAASFKMDEATPEPEAYSQGDLDIEASVNVVFQIL